MFPGKFSIFSYIDTNESRYLTEWMWGMKNPNEIQGGVLIFILKIVYFICFYCGVFLEGSNCA